MTVREARSRSSATNWWGTTRCSTWNGEQSMHVRMLQMARRLLVQGTGASLLGSSLCKWSTFSTVYGIHSCPPTVRSACILSKQANTSQCFPRRRGLFDLWLMAKLQSLFRTWLGSGSPLRDSSRYPIYIQRLDAESREHLTRRRIKRRLQCSLTHIGGRLYYVRSIQELYSDWARWVLHMGPDRVQAVTIDAMAFSGARGMSALCC